MIVLTDIDRQVLAAFAAGDDLHVISSEVGVSLRAVRADLDRLCGGDRLRAAELLVGAAGDIAAALGPPVPVYCGRCGHGCTAVVPCVVVVRTDNGPVCIDTLACAERVQAAEAVNVDTIGAALLADWPAWACMSEQGCGNRYGTPFDACSCGGPLTPVTVQVVAGNAYKNRQPNGGGR